MKTILQTAFSIIAIAIGIILVMKLGMWMFEPPPMVGLQKFENSGMKCWRFSDEQGRGPGPWNCDRKEPQ